MVFNSNADHSNDRVTEPAKGQLHVAAIKLLSRNVGSPTSDSGSGTVSLRLSDGSDYQVSALTVQKFALSNIGAVVSESVLSEIQREHEVTALTKRALDALARARRSRTELVRRLRRHSSSHSAVEEALSQLEAAGLIDDEKTAYAEASARLRSGLGAARVRQILFAKGIDRTVVQNAVTAAIDDSDIDEAASCLQVASRRWNSLKALDMPVAKRRLMAFLLRRGYSSESVRKAVAELTTPR